MQKQENLSELEANWATQQAPDLQHNETLSQQQQKSKVILGLYSEFKANLGYERLCIQKEEEERKRNIQYCCL